MYEIQSRIRYSETDADARLSILGMMNYFQDCSTFHSEDSGVGLSWLEKEKRSWFLSSWQIRISRRPALGETVTIATWPYDFRGIFGMRNFAIYDEMKNPLAEADSCWFLLDTEKGTPCRITERDVAAYGQPEPRIPMEESGRKIALPLRMEEAGTIRVMPHQIDTNHHMNNAQYVELAREMLPAELEIAMIRAEYRKAAVLGDEIAIFMAVDGNTHMISLRGRDGAVFANVALTEKREDERHD